LIDQKAALDAIAGMLPPDFETRRKAFDLIQQILEVRGVRAEENQKLREVEVLFLGSSRQEGIIAQTA